MRFKWLFYLMIPLEVYAMPGYYAPWGKDADLRYIEAAEEAKSIKPSLTVRAAEKIIHFHQNVLSPVDGPRSHYRPSSSNYMKEAMLKHGFITGFFMGCDRLMRENSDEWVYKKIEQDGKLFKYDPVR